MTKKDVKRNTTRQIIISPAVSSIFLFIGSVSICLVRYNLGDGMINGFDVAIGNGNAVMQGKGGYAKPPGFQIWTRIIPGHWDGKGFCEGYRTIIFNLHVRKKKKHIKVERSFLCLCVCVYVHCVCVCIMCMCVCWILQPVDKMTFQFLFLIFIYFF